jgi:hypothetical protein
VRSWGHEKETMNLLDKAIRSLHENETNEVFRYCQPICVVGLNSEPSGVVRGDLQDISVEMALDKKLNGILL